MIREEVLEGNKLIAEFMGGQWIGEDFVADKFSEQVFIDGDGDTCICNYNSSWDWLMPVVENIRKVAFELWDGDKVQEKIWLKADLWACEVSWIDEETGTYPICEPIKCDTFLEAIYKAVIEFIKWYNNNNQLK
jgi:hypothetical protein